MSSRRSSRRAGSGRGAGRGSKRQGGASWLDFAKIALGVLVLGALGAALFVTKSKKDAIDPVTFCNREGPAAVTLVILDASDPIDGVQSERAKAAIRNAAQNSQAGTRLDIFVADTPDGRLASPVFSKCNPGAPGKYETIYANAERHRQEFEESFLAAIEDNLTILLDAKPAKSSPIIESIRSATTASLARLDDNVPIDIYIVSDMVQNSPLLRHKTGSEDFKDFQAGPTWPGALADLRGARIHLMYLARTQYRGVQGRSHTLWWETYFDAVNGRVVSIDTI